MQKVLILVVVLLSMGIVQGQFFGGYNCSTSQYSFLGSTTGYFIGTSSNGPSGPLYATFTDLNSTTSLYFSAYTGQTNAIYSFLPSGNGNIFVADTNQPSTCIETLLNYADEFTRVSNLYRASIGYDILYRNKQLDQAAQNYFSNNGSANLALDATNYTYDQASANNFGVQVMNPGVLVSIAIRDSNFWLLTRTYREMGVYIPPNNQSLWVFAAIRAVGCGNGLVDQTTELCDDGNTVNGDGCSSLCTIELGYSCYQNMFQETSVCSLSSAVTATASVGANKPTSTASGTASVSRSGSMSTTPSTGSTNSGSTTTSASLTRSVTPSFGSSLSTAATIISSFTPQPGSGSYESSGSSESASNSPFYTTGSASQLSSWVSLF